MGEQLRQAGFSLLEVIVGLVLVGLVLTTMLQATRTGVLATDRADQTVMLASAARSVLDRLGTDIPLEEGTRSGVLADGVTWRAVVTPVDSRPGIARLVAVEVEVSGVGGTLTLQTHRARRLRVDEVR